MISKIFNTILIFKWIKTLLQWTILKFGLVGLFSFATGTMIFYFFVDILKYNPTLFLCITFCYTSVQNYILDKFWVFQNKEKSKTQFVKFFGNSLFCFGINFVIFHALKFSLDLPIETIYSIISTLIAAIINYFLTKKFVFKKDK